MLLKLAGLLHDVSKPETKSTDSKGQIHFYGHPEQGAHRTETIMQRLRFGSRETRWVAQLVAAGLIACRRRGQGLVNVLRVLALVTSGHDRPAARAVTDWRSRQGYSSFNKKKEPRTGIYRATEPSEYLMTRYGPLQPR